MNPFGHITRVALYGMSGFTFGQFAIFIELALVIFPDGHWWFSIDIDPVF